MSDEPFTECAVCRKPLERSDVAVMLRSLCVYPPTDFALCSGECADHLVAAAELIVEVVQTWRV